jgi:hypothetical protein
MKRSLFLFIGWAALLSAQVSAPNIGFARFANGVYAVHGIPATFRIADHPLIYAGRASFSDAGGLLWQDGVIRLLDANGTTLGEYASSETAPVLNSDGPLARVIAWLPLQHALVHWNGGALVGTPVDDSGFSGEVSSIQMTSAQSALLLVTHGDLSVSAIAVSVASGDVVSSDVLAPARGHAFAQHAQVISEAAQGLAVDSRDGARRILVLPQQLTIERMSTDWLHIFSASSGEHWALYLTDTEMQLAALPPPKESAR